MNNTNYTQAVKKNLSSIQVLKTLQYLMEGNYTMSELVEKMNAGEDTQVFNNSVISKYINTCRYCGIKIPKIQNRYYITNLPFGLDLTTDELSLIEQMQRIAQEVMSTRAKNLLKNFIDKLSRYSNKHIIRIAEEAADETKRVFEYAIKEQRFIRLMFRVKTVIDCIPAGIVLFKGKQYFKVIHNGKDQLIAKDRIVGLEVLGKNFSSNDLNSETVIYKLTGNLAARYEIKENEQILDNKLPEYIVVTNTGEVRDLLISRLLRYDSLCEIIEPKDLRDEMKKLIEATLANYAK